MHLKVNRIHSDFMSSLTTTQAESINVFPALPQSLTIDIFNICNHIYYSHQPQKHIINKKQEKRLKGKKEERETY